MKARLPLRGGNWNNGANAGLGALNLNNPRSNSNSNIGFRPALAPRRLCSLTGLRASEQQKEPCSGLRTNTLRGAAASSTSNAAAPRLREDMPRTHTHLWPTIIDWENLHRSYIEARRGKRYNRDALEFAEYLEDNLIEIHNQLAWRTWAPRPMRLFTVREPKPRHIAAPAFRDRVVHHALVDVIEPLFERRFISHSYACRVGRGTHAAVNRVQRLTRRADCTYYFQGDVHRYFPSINHDILKSAVRRVIADPNTLWLVDTIIDAHGPGVPIGALTSQLFANIYLDHLDHFVTDNLGLGTYVRYMDGFLVLGASRRELRRAEEDIRLYLREQLALDLNPKSRTAPVSRGIDFCGYRIWPYHRLPRKRNVKHARRRLQARAREAQRTGDTSALRATIMSFIGYMRHCSGHRTLDSVLNDIVIGGPHDP